MYLSAQFGAPIRIGGLTTADPMDSSVKAWWVNLANTIYAMIPDFGGFLVKANSEGQPGPADYGRTHADGANMLEAALSPHGGIVLWRAFVYSDNGTDRIAQSYNEFKPLDGKFASGTMVQVKNGPLDFQPREPFHQLFGAMPGTPLALELQITKEYLGEDTHLAYLGPMWQEVLRSDTHAKGQGSLVAQVITAIAGVSGIGSDANWMGSHFNQANWYAFGRLAWDPDLNAQEIADEWIRQTFSNDPVVVAPVTQMMMNSRQNLVNYMEPIGLVHMMGTNTHYGPAPWVNNLPRPDTNPFYFHKADATGIGFESDLHRQRRRGAILSDGGERARDPQHHARRPPAVLPAREVGRRPVLVGTHDLERARLPLQCRRRRGSNDAQPVADGAGADRQQTLQRRRQLFANPTLRSPMVAGYLPAILHEREQAHDAERLLPARAEPFLLPEAPEQLPRRSGEAALPRHLHRQSVARDHPTPARRAGARGPSARSAETLGDVRRCPDRAVCSNLRPVSPDMRAIDH